MAKSKRSTKILTCILLVALLVSTIFTVYMSATGRKDELPSPSFNRYDGSLNTGIENYYDGSVMYKLPDGISASEELSLIIKLPTTTLLDAYEKGAYEMSFSEFAATDEAAKIREEINQKSRELQKKLKSERVRYSVGQTYDTVLSGFEITAAAGDFEAICKTLSKDAMVIVGESFETAKTELVENNVNVYNTGIFNSAGFGYDGTGMVVAVLDTGLDYYHSAFNTNGFINNNDEGKLGLTQNKLSGLLSDTEASKIQPGLTVSDVYISNKVPFGFDYADRDSDVFPLNSNHGTHVAGVIAGNRLDHIVSEDYEGEFVGVAPGAQLAIMKIFSDTVSTARTSWILAALEDCVALGVDVINMSIGTACGFSREMDREAVSGVYDRIRDTGISMVVAASNSYNSSYGSDKNGNLPLTSNPDSATIGSPSTYKGALSVASIEGAKTPYLLFGDTIIYFEESTDRVSKEKNFVKELLGSSGGEKELEYVLIAGAGSSVADYSGIDITGKIALIKRGYNTFEEKAALAEKMGAAGVIIYNNVSGEIKMNVGETAIPVCSISQNDGELLAAARSGKIKISSYQTSGPFMSDFSSWGPTPDLEIKPEITAHGGSILSSVPGESYDRISGTSMATPNISGVTALLRQYVKERFPEIKDDSAEVAAVVNRLMMSTADIIINTNGLPYSIRKQGAGLANLANTKNTNAYILTYDREDGSVMDKSKIELGDDPEKKGAYSLTFSVVNFGDSALSYDVDAIVLTEGVSETKTNQGQTTVTEDAYELSGAEIAISGVEGGTRDGMRISVAAGQTAAVTLTIKLTDENKRYLNESFENGMYVEGYVTLDAVGEGVVDLSVPYLAFYGDWTVAPLFDLDYFETNKDELDDAIDLLDKTLPDAYASRPIGGTSDDYVSYLGSYYFEQNPQNIKIAADRKYISLSNQSDTVNSLRFVWAGLLRNAKAIDITITEDATGEVVYHTVDDDVRKSYGDGGPICPAQVEVEFSAIENNLKNNTAYTVTLKGVVDYGDGGKETNKNNTFTFPLVTDFEAPALTGVEFYTEYDRSTKKTRLYAKMAVYDNHYSMAMLIGQVGLSPTDLDGNGALDDANLNGFDRYLTPVYSDFNSTSYVVYELTDYIDEIATSVNKNCFTVVCYDYALNSATYEIPLPDDYTDFYFKESEETIGNYDGLDYHIALSPNEVYTLNPVVYPAKEWAELITYTSSNTKVARIVGNKVIALSGGITRITASANVDGKTIRAHIYLRVLEKGDKGYKVYSQPVADSFTVTGFYTNKAFYQLNTEDRKIGSTGDEVKFASQNNLSLEMYPSESVTLRYELDAYFPSDTEVVFTSGNEKIVKIDKHGTITAMEEGLSSVTIEVKLNGKSTYFSKSINIEVKDPFITTGPSLTHYFGAGSDGVVTFPKTLAITDIGQFAFSNFDYVPKDADDEISEEVPELTKLWFIGDDDIKEVVIPDGVKSIGPYAFANLTALKKITIPASVEIIDYGAFYGCSALETVVGIENVKFINYGAFEGCALKGNISLTNAVAVANYAFAGNTKITGVTLDTVQSIGKYAFAGNTAMKSFTIKSEKVKLGQYAFSECKALTSATINAAVIPTGAFNECTSLSSVTLGKDVKVVSEYAFRNAALTSFTVKEGNSVYTVGTGSYLLSSDGTELLLVAPAYKGSNGVFTLNDNRVTAIGDAAFSGNKHLKSIIVPSVTMIGKYAFAECVNLKSVTFGAVTYIGDFAFENTSISSVPDLSSVEILGKYAFVGTDITEVVIPADMNVPEGAFKNCHSLESVTIGDGVNIGKGAFALESDNWGIDYYEINNGMENVYFYVYNSALTSLTIGKDVYIGESAFMSAASLESVTLGDGAEIGNEAFFNTPKLKNIDTSKVKSIGDAAFSGYIHYEYASEDCSVISIDDTGAYRYHYYAPVFTSINLSSLTELGKEAFAYCKSLESVTLGDNLFTVSEGSFRACDSLASINLLGVKTVGDSAFAECKLSEVNLASAENVEKYAFCYNENLTAVTLAEGVKIGEGAFSECSALSTLKGEEGAEYIGDYAFAYANLTEIDLSGAEYIGSHAFMKREDDYSPLTVKLGENLSQIGENPFAFCEIAPFSTITTESFNGKDYESVVYTFDISDNVKIIDGSIYRVVPKGFELITWTGDSAASIADGTVRVGAMAFAGGDIKSVTIPSTVTSIGHKAFYKCDKLSLVTFKSYEAPILEEEYDEYYFAVGTNLPASGEYQFYDDDGSIINIPGLGIVPYFMWNVTSLPTNVYYGASFIDYVGHVDNKITMVRPTNGKYYDSFIMDQYFTAAIYGAAAPDDITLEAIAAIGKIPENTKDIKLSHKPIIEAARAAYEKIMSYEQRALVPSEVLARLTAAEQRIEDLMHTKSDNADEGDGDAEEGLELNVILNIVIGAVFAIVVIAFIVVLIIFIRMMKKGAYTTSFAKSKKDKPEGENQKQEAIEKPDGQTAESDKPEPSAKATQERAPITQIIHKAAPVQKLKKSDAIKLADVDDILSKKESRSDRNRKIIIIASSILAGALLIAGIIFAIYSSKDSFYSDYDDEGYTVSVTFDSCGGTFKGSDSTLVDLFKPEDIGQDGIKLLAPDDKKRDKSNSLTVTKSGYFLAGWYAERTLIDENDPEKGYTYSNKWNFATDTLTIDPNKEYSAENSVLTLYAAWVPYYNFEIYTEDESGDEILLSTVSAINLTLPQWRDGDVTLDMDNFPKRSDFTLESVEVVSHIQDITRTETETKVSITGKWDEDTATSLTPTIKLMTTWQEGERYRIYSAEDLRKHADSNGYYEIYNDLDFTGIDWPSVFVNGKFSGKIFGNNHTITGISIESSSRSRINNGIFASLDETAYIENLEFENTTHTINLMSVAPGASFGLLAGTVSDGADFSNVTVKGKIIIGDSCAELATSSDSFTIGKLAGAGSASGIASDISVEKENPDNTDFQLEISSDGAISIIPGSN